MNVGEAGGQIETPAKTSVEYGDSARAPLAYSAENPAGTISFSERAGIYVVTTKWILKKLVTCTIWLVLSFNRTLLILSLTLLCSHYPKHCLAQTPSAYDIGYFSDSEQLTDPLRDKESCTHLDLRDGPFKGLPVLEQIDNTCFAYAAAQMIDAWRFTHGDTNRGHVTSPVAATFNSIHDSIVDGDVSKDSAYESSIWPCEVIETIKRHGSCNLEAIRDRFGPIGISNPRREGGSFGKYITDLQKLVRDKHVLYRQDFSTKNRTHLDKITYDFQEEVCRIQNEVGIPQKFFPSTEDLLLALKSPSLDVSLDKVVTSNCKPPYLLLRPWPKGKEPSCIGEFDRSKFSGLIDRVLESGQPAGIAFCSSILFRGPDYIGLKPHLPCKAETTAHGRPQDHAALVIGRRWNKERQTCQYLIRNSWGDFCQRLKDECKKDPNEYVCFWECENGHQWVDAVSLERNLVGVSFLR